MSNQKYLITYPPLQAVPGLTFRHFAGEQDYPTIHDLWLRTSEFNGFDWVATLEDIKQDEKHRPNFDMKRQFIFAELDGEPIGYLVYNWYEAQAQPNQPKDIILSVPFSLLEEYWQTPIPQLMLTFMEEKQREEATALPQNQPKYFSVWKESNAKEQIAFYEAKGYQPVRYFFTMHRPIDKPLSEHPLPQGIEIRPVTPNDYRKASDAAHEAFRENWGYVGPTEERFQAWLQDRLFQPHLWKVAWEGDEIVGRVGNFVDEEENAAFNRKRGYTEGISVRKPWRGRGIAKALIAESIRMFKEMGMDHTTLGVDAENPSGALKLYISMGYEEDESETSIILRKRLSTD
jgi:mycothiol synthase